MPTFGYAMLMPTATHLHTLDDTASTVATAPTHLFLCTVMTAYEVRKPVHSHHWKIDRESVLVHA
jgi:tRNA A22 N-methylase